MNSDDFPRKGSAIYSLTKGKKRDIKLTLSRWKTMNKIVVPLYRVGLLPLLGLGRIFLLITTKGRRTGKIRVNPLEYRVKDGVIHVFSGRGVEADWYRNMLRDPDSVRVRVGFRCFKPRVRIVTNPSEKEEILRWYVRKYPRDAGFLVGWDSRHDDPYSTDIGSLVELIQVVKLEEDNTN